MRLTRRCLPTLALLVLAATPLTTARADAIDDRVAAFLKEHQVPGISLAIARNGQAIKARGYGRASVELDVPATERTVYQIGSISKPIAAIAIMMLVEDGKLSLDAPIGSYWQDPDASLPDHFRPLTLGQLLSHTSGIKSITEIPVFSYRRDYTPAEFLELVGAYPLEFPPGSRFHYCNSGPPIAAMVLAKAAGQPFEEFVADRIFRPLGMASTRFEDDAAIVPNRATGHRLRQGTLTRGVSTRPKVAAASGGVLSTVIDLLKLDAALDGEALLKRSTLEAMWTPRVLTDGSSSSYGLGWSLPPTRNGHPRIFHGGSTAGGFEASYHRFPECRLTVVAFSNRQSAPMSQLVLEIAELAEPKLATPRDAATR